MTERTGYLSEHSLIAKLSWHWSRSGHRVTTGPIDTIASEIDVAILHIDRTRIASQWIPANPLQRPFLNDRVLDISKRHISTIRLSPADIWNGEVIIKSNLNFFGSGEWNDRHHGYIERVRRRLAQKHWRLARMLPPMEYPILPDMSAVPGWVWKDPELIVERFVPECEGDLYCLRGWVFFGSRGYTYRMFSTKKVVKVAGIVRHEFLGDPPHELVEFREKGGWDFGKFDYVEVDGLPILLDANKTPSIAGGPDSPRLQNLEQALGDFLGES